MNDEIAQNAPEPIQQRLSRLPTRPGVYIFKNKNGTIIYVGKAKQLKNRVRSYFQKARPIDAKTKALREKIQDLEYILVDNEAEAFILEDTLIKKHKPRYNIDLRDDKTYPFVRVTNEEYPRVFTTRSVVRDGSKYFGPFTEVKRLKGIMRTIRSVFNFRSCNLNITEESIKNKKHKVCLDYHIDKCQGPCEGLISKEEYLKNIRKAIQIITGRTRQLEKMLSEEMMMLSEEMKYEEAAKVRNRLLRLKDYTSKQKIVTTENIDRDIFAIARHEGYGATIVLKIREGRLVGKRHFIIKNVEEENDDKLIQRTVERWYIENGFVPSEILLPCEPADIEYLIDWLGKKKGKAIRVQIPQIGDKKKLIEMARSNASFIVKEYILSLAKRDQSFPRTVASLQRDLMMKSPPRRIECFDNSHIQGSELVSSMVCFIDGKPRKSEYRKYKAKEVNKNDDFAAMREVIRRRYSRLIEEQDKEEATPLPDLIIIDGGKGQLSSAYEILKDLGIAEEITIIGLAKKLEEVFFFGKKEPTILPRTSSSLRLIQQLRDEAHRFAITFHRQLRSKRTLKTSLTEIEGVGEKTSQKLLIEFGSVENIKQKNIEELSKIVNSKQAKAVYEYFNNLEKDKANE